MKIAIVGAGIAGLVTAYMAARAGHTVAVFEKDKVGAGASGRSLGVLVPISLDRPVDRLQREGIAAWPELAAAVAKFSGEDLGAFFREWGDGRYQLRVPAVFAVLKEAVERLGGVVREGCGEVSARDLPGYDWVILASGLGHAGVLGGMKVSAGQALRLRPPAPLNRLVAGDNLFLCPDWDGSVLVGSENWTLDAPGDGKAKHEVTEELLRRALALAPELEGAEVVEAWVGYRPVSEPRLPLVREVGGGVLAVAGLGKTGLGLAPVVGSTILKSII